MKCRSCQASVVFANHIATGRRMIFDEKPSSSFVDGSFLIDSDAKAVQATPMDRGPFYVSHFASCPDAEKWRNRRRG